MQVVGQLKAESGKRFLCVWGEKPTAAAFALGASAVNKEGGYAFRQAHCGSAAGSACADNDDIIECMTQADSRAFTE